MLMFNKELLFLNTGLRHIFLGKRQRKTDLTDVTDIGEYIQLRVKLRFRYHRQKPQEVKQEAHVHVSM